MRNVYLKKKTFWNKKETQNKHEIVTDEEFVGHLAHSFFIPT